MEASSPFVVWERPAGSLLPLLLGRLLPIGTLCLGSGGLFVVDRSLGLPLLLTTVLALPLLLTAAETAWARRRPRQLRLDRSGMWLGDQLRIRWSEVSRLEAGTPHPSAARVGIKVKLDPALPRPSRSLLLALGLLPADGGFDFWLSPDDYGVPPGEMARVMESLRQPAT